MATISITEVQPYEYIYIWRKRLNLNQTEMAKKLNTTRKKLSEIELGGYPDDYPTDIIISEIETCILLRRRSGLNQGELGEILDISRILINGMENGRLNPARLIKYWRS